MCVCVCAHVCMLYFCRTPYHRGLHLCCHRSVLCSVFESLTVTHTHTHTRRHTHTDLISVLFTCESEEQLAAYQDGGEGRSDSKGWEGIRVGEKGQLTAQRGQVQYSSSRYWMDPHHQHRRGRVQFSSSSRYRDLPPITHT